MEVIRRPDEDGQINNNQIKQDDADEERQNAHKMRFETHLDIVNKSDVKKYAGKTLRMSIHEIVPNDMKVMNNKGKKESLNVKTYHPV